MKIGIITHWWCFENYGQLLQCYAFQRFLKLRGHEPFLIRYFPGSAFGDRMTLARIFRKLKSIPGFLRSVVSRVDGTKRRIAMRRAVVESARDFNGFRQNYLTMTQDIYRSYAEIQHAKEVDADLYSVGSDVVWGMVPLNNDGRVFFLDFGRKSAKRIAYSPSFGAATLSDEYKRFAAPLIQKLDYVSVREPSGVKLCAEMGCNNAVCVMDPVFLLNREQWVEAFGVPSSRAGVFSYLLQSSVNPKLLVETARTLAGHFRARLQITTVYSDEGFPPELLSNPTIPEWVRLVGSSQFVLTNSFHCTSLAILLHTPFVVVLKNGGKGMDNRLLSILDRVGLQNRVFDPRVNSIDEIVSRTIDWDQVDRSVERELVISFGYLKNIDILEHSDM